MSGNMKRLRRTNNPLDRNTRNDINYNWEVLDNTLSNIDTSDFETEQQFNKVDSQIKELKQVDKQLSDRIKKNRDDIDAMDLDLLIEQGNVAEQKGQVAKKQGDKTEEQGNIAEQKGNKAEEQGNTSEAKGIKAEQQGDYAEEQGSYANEKAEYAAETTSKIIEANEDLAKVKLDTVEATQKANKSADYAKEQGDYAKDTADKVNVAHADLSKLKEETITATTKANDATDKAIEATDKANTSSEKAAEQATRAKEKTDYLETLLPNIEGWEFKGEWEHKAEYEKHNIVTFNGSTYILFPDTAEGSPADDSGWHMLARRGIDGEGAVQTVNNLAPDLEGNVDLGELATPDDVKDAADKTLNQSKEYTDAQISEIPEVDISHLETKEDATAKLEEAKAYTDEKLGDVDLSEMEKQISDHSKEIATTDKTGHVQIGKGLDIDKSGILSTKTASKEAIESGVSDDEFITPKGLDESKEEIVKSVVDTSKLATKDSVKKLREDVMLGNDIGSRDSVFIGKNNRTFSQGSNILSYIFSMGKDNFIGSSNSWVYGTTNKVQVSSNFPSFVFGVNNNINTSLQSIVHVLGYNLQVNDNNVANNSGSEMGAVTVMGIANKGRDDYLFHYGNGDFIGKNRSDALAITKDGDLLVQGVVETYGADYAEMFEWEDGNPDDVDRVALAVTWGEGEAIKLANAGDDIIGIVSATAAILGDNPMDWGKRFVTDQFGRKLRKKYTEVDENGVERAYEWFVENPEYDPEKEYIPRNRRPEWDAIGLVGKLYWIDDGTLEVGDYATVGKDGMATKGNKDNGYRVMKRISKSVDGKQGIVKVFFK